MTAQPDSTGPSRDGASRAPLVAHPLFPAIVALWVAVALAVAGLALPVSLLERAAAAVRLDELVPAARAPLGFTARLLVAFALGVAGALAGYAGAIALRARAGRAAGRPQAAPTAASSIPAANCALLDDEDLVRLAAAQAGPAQRRRSLTAETEATGPSILEISTLPTLEPLTPASTAATAEPVQPTPPAPRFRTIEELAGSAALQLCAAPLARLGVVQLAERFALALHHRRNREGAGGESASPATAAPQPAPAPFSKPLDPGETRAAAQSGRPFDMPADPGTTPQTPTAGRSDPSLSAPAGQAPETDGGDDHARWALPEPEGEGEHIDEDLTPDPGAMTGYGSLVDMRPSSRVPPPLADFVRVDDDAPAVPAAEGPQPVVVFPGQAVPAPPLPADLTGMDAPVTAEETEAALRQALAALQRMSGTA